MSTKLLRNIILASSLLFGSQIQAEIVSSETWHYTADDFGGLKQSFISEDVFFALTRFDIYDSTKEYEAIDGYSFASKSEYEGYIAAQLSSQTGDVNSLVGVQPYYGKGGWDGYPSTAPNVGTQYKFIFSDAITVGGFVHAGSYETNLQNEIFSTGSTGILGFVMIRDAGLIVVDEPVSNVSSPMKIGLTSLFMMGFMVRRKTLQKISIKGA